MKHAICIWVLTWISATALAATTAPAPVTTVEVANRSLLADANGMTLYVFDVDKTSSSTCYNQCASAWPAEVVPANATVSAPFATSPRTDGTIQLTLNGRPLYHYAGDKKSGDIKGDGLGGVWHVVPFN